MEMKRLLTSLCMVLLTISAWAQSGQTVTMELTDVYGDKAQTEVKGGSTFYLSQQPSNTDWRGYSAGGRYGYLVVCDKEGRPYYEYSLSQLSSITFKNVPQEYFAPTHDLAHSPTGDRNRFTFHMTDGDYQILDLGEWTLDESMRYLTLTTALGATHHVALALLKSIERCEPGAGLSQYLIENLNDAQLYRWAFYNGSTYSNATDYMRLYFFASVPSYEDGEKNITLLVPTDEAMSHIVDPVSFNSRKPRVLNLYYKNASFPIYYNMYSYNSETGEVAQGFNQERMTNDEICNRLRMILRSHALVHQTAEERALGLRCGNEYFQGMDGSVVRVVKDTEGTPIGVQGTFEMDNERNGLTNVTITEQNQGAYTEPWSLSQCHFTETLSKGNAIVYKLDNSMNATPRSAYSVLSTDSAFSRFIELCGTDKDVLRACGIIDEKNLTSTQQRNMLARYGVFVDKYGMDYNVNLIGHRPFTIFVPTNEAIESEIAKNQLPTWEEITAQYEACEKDSLGHIANQADSVALQNKCMKLVNFVRAHIQFGLDIADQLPFEREHNTIVVKPATLATPRLTVKGLGQGRMTVTDETGQTHNVLDAKKNIFVRDIECSRSPVNVATMNGITVDGYANGVIHQIDGVLKYREN